MSTVPMTPHTRERSGLGGSPCGFEPHRSASSLTLSRSRDVMTAVSAHSEGERKAAVECLSLVSKTLWPSRMHMYCCPSLEPSRLSTHTHMHRTRSSKHRGFPHDDDEMSTHTHARRPWLRFRCDQDKRSCKSGLPRACRSWNLMIR